MPPSANPNGEIEEVDAITQFPQFDVADDDSDHHYINLHKPANKAKPTNGPDCFSNPSSEVYKKIMKEWKVLEKNLPDTIFVRVYERRIDLLRAAIIGPAGTPYHDGLFFFDLSFPPDYPTRPPQVHYRSFGLRINPNLYANGVVCLSLLNTWFGKKNEKWNPAESTVLQILVSIQGLVLNKDPYFNEPGVGIFPGRVKKSVSYSENTFVLSCKTMVYLLRRPPKNFEDFVNWHFRRRSCDILSACNAYVSGRAKVGLCGDNGSDSVEVSRSFKAAMVAWYPEMVLAFKRAGGSVGHFVEQQLGDENKTASLKAKKTEEERKTVSSGKGVVKKVVSKIRKIFGLKKVGAENI